MGAWCARQQEKWQREKDERLWEREGKWNYKDFKTMSSFTKALRRSGLLDDMQLVFAIDATKSNETNGVCCYSGRSLHDTSARDTNPYSIIIETTLKTLANEGARIQDEHVPLYYFGSIQARQNGGIVHVKDCNGLHDLHNTYLSTIRGQTFAGPTTFIPLIEETIELTARSKRFHVLVVITDGVVSDLRGHMRVLNEASYHPISIVCVGVGDGPWDGMEKFDDDITVGRAFDNFQFFEFDEIYDKYKNRRSKLEEEFFLNAFMECPNVYEAAKRHLKYIPRAEVKAIKSRGERLHGYGYGYKYVPNDQTDGHKKDFFSGNVDSIRIKRNQTMAGRNMLMSSVKSKRSGRGSTLVIDPPAGGHRDDDDNVDDDEEEDGEDHSHHSHHSGGGRHRRNHSTHGKRRHHHSARKAHSGSGRSHRSHSTHSAPPVDRRHHRKKKKKKKKKKTKKTPHAFLGVQPGGVNYSDDDGSEESGGGWM